MCGLPQAGIIAQQLLETRLATHGYHQSTTTPGLWQHNMHPICFTLVVNNFGVKYVNKANAEHLLNAIQKYYKFLSNRDAKRYCGLTFNWDYEGRKVHSSMPNYLAKVLHRFQHLPPCKSTKPAISPGKTKLWNQGAVCKSGGYFPPLDKAGKKFI